MKQGRQTALDCLSLLEEFIIGQIIVVCKGARSGARPCFFIKVIHKVIHRLWTVGNAVGRGAKWPPPGVKYHGGSTHTPQQKIYAKVRSAVMS
jgi:hypothetical protein